MAKTDYLDPSRSNYGRFKTTLQMYEIILDCVDKAAIKPELASHLDQGFDVVINFNTLAGPEVVGRYLAQRSNASLVLYATAQGPTTRVSNLIGQPFHPAYMNQPGALSLERLTFADRVINTVVSILMDLSR